MSLLLRIIASISLCTLLTVLSLGQPRSSYQNGTIIAVKPHQPASNDEGKKQYDISVQVIDMVYVVLYTAPPGAKSAEYSAGTDRPVLVEGDQMTFSDLRGQSIKVPILSRKHVSKARKSAPVGE